MSSDSDELKKALGIEDDGEYRIDPKTGKVQERTSLGFVDTNRRVDPDSGNVQEDTFLGPVDTGKRIDPDSGNVQEETFLGPQNTETRVNPETGEIQERSFLGWQETGERINPETGDVQKRGLFGWWPAKSRRDVGDSDAKGTGGGGSSTRSRKSGGTSGGRASGAGGWVYVIVVLLILSMFFGVLELAREAVVYLKNAFTDWIEGFEAVANPYVGSKTKESAAPTPTAKSVIKSPTCDEETPGEETERVDVETGIEDAVVEVSSRKDKVYIVKKGDTLWEIAEEYYGSGCEWYRIRNANKDKIGYMPNGQQKMIWPGQELVIPWVT